MRTDKNHFLEFTGWFLFSTHTWTLFPQYLSELLMFYLIAAWLSIKDCIIALKYHKPVFRFVKTYPIKNIQHRSGLIYMQSKVKILKICIMPYNKRSIKIFLMNFVFRNFKYQSAVGDFESLISIWLYLTIY